MRGRATSTTGMSMAAVLLSAAWCAAQPQNPASTQPALDVVAEMTDLPGNIAVTPDGRVVVSLHQFRPARERVVEVRRDGSTRPFPDAKWNRDEAGHDALDTVLGIRCDSDGVVWMLDNAMRGKTTPKLVAWDTQADRLRNVIFLPPPVTRENSFVNDLQVDVDAKAIYIADPAGGANAALIVVDLATGRSRRVLEGHRSVAAEDIDLVVEGRVLELHAAGGGASARARIGVNPIALDATNQWLYFGPMSGRTLYRVRTRDLRNAELSSEDLGARVEEYAQRPPSDGIAMDAAGNVYITEIAATAIGVITPQRAYRRLIEDPRLSWPDAFSGGPDGWMYVVANQLHRTPPLNGGVDATRPPYRVLRFQPLAAVPIGR